MKHLRLIDSIGNKRDYESEVVPRIGERITLMEGTTRLPVHTHHFRVKDVEYRLNNPHEHQVAILVEEETDRVGWPS